MDLAKKPLSVQETWETRYEQLMEQFASDMRLYMGMVSALGRTKGGSCCWQSNWGCCSVVRLAAPPSALSALVPVPFDSNSSMCSSCVAQPAWSSTVGAAGAHSHRGCIGRVPDCRRCVTPL
jgi:hypothetical protein